MMLKSLPALLFVKSDTLQAKESRKLLEAIKESQSAIDKAYISFKQAVDPLLIDCYIYEMNAAQKRYQYLLKCARSLGLQNIPTALETQYLLEERR